MEIGGVKLSDPDWAGITTEQRKLVKHIPLDVIRAKERISLLGPIRAYQRAFLYLTPVFHLIKIIASIKRIVILYDWVHIFIYIYFFLIPSSTRFYFLIILRRSTRLWKFVFFLPKQRIISYIYPYKRREEKR